MIKLRITLFTMLFSVGSIFSQTATQENFILKIENKKISKTDKQTFLLLPVTLTNQTKDTLKYFSFSCSWQDFYSTDNQSIRIAGQDCDKNVPIILTLAPKQSKTVNLKLLISTNDKTTLVSFRVGMNLLKAKMTNDRYSFKMQTKKKNIVWSNKIEIQT